MTTFGIFMNVLLTKTGEIMEPQFICLTCKTVIGPTWDDYDNQCNCKDIYDIEVYRVISAQKTGGMKYITKNTSDRDGADNKIFSVEIEKETTDSVWIDGTRRPKLSKHYTIHDSVQSAKDYLKNHQKRYIKWLNELLSTANIDLGKITKLEAENVTEIDRPINLIHI